MTMRARTGDAPVVLLNRNRFLVPLSLLSSTALLALSVGLPGGLAYADASVSSIGDVGNVVVQKLSEVQERRAIDQVPLHESEAEPAGDASNDAGSDAPADAGSDVGSDTGSDEPVDAGSDTGSDEPVDAGSDSPVDMGSDVGSDEPVDTGSDSSIAKIGRVVARKASEIGSAEPLSDVDYTSRVGTIMQNDVMAGGCELVSLGIALESMGVEVNFDSLVYDYLDMSGSYASGYAGDPFYAGSGFPPGIVSAANGYLEGGGYAVRAYNISGASFEELSDYVAHGYPVLVWTTMGFDDPFLTGVFDEDVEWYDNEHCVVLYGFTEDGGAALVSDPLDGYVERDTARFADLYIQCGSYAVVVR